MMRSYGSLTPLILARRNDVSTKEKTLDERIEAAQKKVMKYSKPYHEAMDELKYLLGEKNKIKQDLLLEAIKKSRRSYEEVMEPVCSNPNNDECYEPGN